MVGKNEKLFPSPERFHPERWARDKSKLNPFAFLPFGFGPRSCYGIISSLLDLLDYSYQFHNIYSGKRFAELELKLLLCQVISNCASYSNINDSMLISLLLTDDTKICFGD